MATIGEKIKEARRSIIENGKPVNQARFAELIGLGSYQMVSRYENDENSPDAKMLKKISAATGKPISWFFDEDTTTPEIKTVADVIVAIGMLSNAFGSGFDASPVIRPYSGREYYELRFCIPYSYKKVFEQLQMMREWREKGMPDEAGDAWLKSLMEEQSRISVEDMIKEVDSDEVQA